jgi:hypothetical protein
MKISVEGAEPDTARLIVLLHGGGARAGQAQIDDTELALARRLLKETI